MIESTACRTRTLFATLLLMTTSTVGCSDVEQAPYSTPAAEEVAPMPSPGSDPERDSSPANTNTPEGVPGFSWVTPALAGLPKPGASGDLPRDLAFLSEEEVDVLVSLTVTPIDQELVREHDMAPEHIPVTDGTAPTPDQIDRFIGLTVDANARDEKVAVHCLAGKGRTGTMLAAWLIHEGQTAEQAMAEIRRLRPGSIETASQEQALADFELRTHNSPDGGANPPGDDGQAPPP